MKPTAVYYVVLLLIFVAGISAVLHSGQKLPAPVEAAGVAPAASTGLARNTAPAESAYSGLGKNLREPVSRLFLQLLIIIAVSRLAGRAFALCGQPSVVGEMAAGI